jgi:hypothetical protein
MADIDLTPTEEMASNAARGLELREKHGRGGTAVGVARARDIKNRKNLSPDTVRRMHSFFSRHAGNEAGGEDDAGYISFLLWGGAAGRSWAKRKSAQLDKDENAMSDTRKEIMERLGSAGKVKSGRAEQVMRDGTVHLDFRAAKEWLAGVTDSALRYIINDAQQAAKAMPDGNKWNYYHDLSLTAQDELQRRKRKSARPGVKAKMARWTLDASEGWGDLSKQWTATINGTQWAIVVEGATGNGSLMRVQPGRAPQTIKRGSVEQLKRYAETLKSSRPGAKAKMAMIPIGTMRRLKKNYDEYLAYLHRNDPKRKPMSFDEFVDEHKESVKNSPMFDSNQFSRPGAKAKFGLEVGEAFEFEGKVYVVNSNADKISFLLSSLRSNSEKAMMLAAYMHKGWISYEGKRKSSRPGVKAKMGKWESTLTKKHGKTIEEYTARLKGGMFKIEVGEGSGGPYAILYRWDDLRGLERIASGNLQSLMRQAESMGAKEARGVAAVERLANYARPGAKAKMARIAGNSLVLDSGDVFKITEWDDLSNAAPAIRDVISKAGVVTDKKGRMWYLRIRKNGTFVLQVPTAGGQTIQGRMESSRPGAKAKFAEDAREVAQEILRQLGGGRFMAMVGGKNAFHGTFGGKAGLQFDIGKGADGGVNRVIVKLDRGTDTYDMEFWRIGNRGMNVKKVSEASGVYADDLQRIFTSRTKFYTSLSRPGAKAHNAIREGEKVSASDDAVSRKIRKLMDEGKPQKQAVAIALDLERRGEL